MCRRWAQTVWNLSIKFGYHVTETNRLLCCWWWSNVASGAKSLTFVAHLKEYENAARQSDSGEMLDEDLEEMA